MSVFGTLGREITGATRSFIYDVRTSGRFRTVVTLTLAAVASGIVLIAFTMRGLGGIDGPVPDQRDSAHITNGWGQIDSRIVDQQESDEGAPPAPSPDDVSTPAPSTPSSADTSSAPSGSSSPPDRISESGTHQPDELIPVPTSSTTPPDDDDDGDDDGDDDDGDDDDEDDGGDDGDDDDDNGGKQD
ncbi:hypothetical protein [Natronoglycomyces albus]|uniref:Uncharacterized protein n=1 Tax=Natronoglycomyces albus TaxID=2811108 RepID=A0A895XGA8_9ACTN|nr:hypothetical protein [Natronoglycomyces albus]QSB03897.1 hypothetical protein JQS30_08650 [Natronoglycomyces albus]